MLNYIWAGMIILSVLYGIATGRMEQVGNGAIESTKEAVSMCITMLGIMSMWMGFMNVASKSGIIKKLEKLLEPIIMWLFPGLPHNHNAREPIVTNIIANILIPVVLIIVVFSVISKITERIQIERISKFLKSSVVWFLGIFLTIFVGIVSLEGTLSSSVDGITAKTAKAAVSSLIPVVGKVLGDVVDSVLGCGIILKNAVGAVGVIVIIGICIVPVIKVAVLSIMYSLASAIVEPVADTKIVKLLEEMSGVFKLLLAILCSLSVILIIGVTMVVKISNSGMMYR